MLHPLAYVSKQKQQSLHSVPTALALSTSSELHRAKHSEAPPSQENSSMGSKANGGHSSLHKLVIDDPICGEPRDMAQSLRQWTALGFESCRRLLMGGKVNASLPDSGPRDGLHDKGGKVEPVRPPAPKGLVCPEPSHLWGLSACRSSRVIIDAPPLWMFPLLM